MPIIQMIIIQLIIFAATIILLKKFIYKDISSVLERLRKLQTENLQKDEELKEKIDMAKKEYEMKILRGEEEIKKLKDDAKAEAQKAREEILQNARQNGNAIMENALMKKDDIRLELEAGLGAESVLLAKKIIRSFFSSNVVEDIHHQLIDEAMKEIMKLNPGQIKEEVEKAVIITPVPLSSDQREKFSSFISTILKKKVVFQEEIDKTIIAGLIIKLDSLMLDVSFNNRLYQIAEKLKEVEK